MSKFNFVNRGMNKKRTLALTAMLLVGLSASDGYCNAGIPGPLLLTASQFSSDPLQWIAVNMVMCITIEGAIYHYLQIFHRPFLGSMVANVVSLVAGFPLALLAVIDPTWVVLPTIASIFIEYVVLKKFRKKVTLPDSPEATYKDISIPVALANILTNFFMVLYLIKSYVFT